jgi:hypothetical protein
MPLGAIFILRERDASAATPRIEPMTAASAILSLVANTYGNYLLDSEMRRQEFVLLGRSLRDVPVFQVWPSGDPSRVYDLCEAIAAEARSGTACAVRS